MQLAGDSRALGEPLIQTGFDLCGELPQTYCVEQPQQPKTATAQRALNQDALGK